MTTGRKQLVWVTGILALSVILYLAPQKVFQGKEIEQPQKGDSFQSSLVEAKSTLKREERESIHAVETALDKDKGNLVLMDSLGKLWDRVQMPAIAAHYFEAIAERQPSETNWINAAYRYFDAFKFAVDSTERNRMVDKSISAYKKVLEINPNNLDAKTDLGVCYVEGTAAPMQGILLLREVVEKNPDHENAQFNLGVLSLKSNQNDKAIERFKKVLEINPKRVEAKVLLGKSYMLAGLNDQALEILESVKKQTSDKQIMQEVNSLISQINNH